MGAQGGDALRAGIARVVGIVARLPLVLVGLAVVILVAADDFHHRQRQQPLPGFLERAVEDLSHLAAQLLAGRHQRQPPQHHRAQRQPQRQPPLQAGRRPHRPSPSR